MGKKLGRRRPKSPRSTTAPRGGSATLYGVLYQLLGSLHETVTLQRIGRKKGAVVSASILVEPPEGGGDIRIKQGASRMAQQWKARTSGRAWGLQEIQDQVLPDLYLTPALDVPGDKTKYIFATEGHVGPKAKAFFQKLKGPVPEGDPLTGLGKEDRKTLRKIAKAVRRRAHPEPVASTHRKLRRLLGRFEIWENQTTDLMIAQIDRMLLPLVGYVEDISAKRDELCTKILRRGTGKDTGNQFMPEDLLKEASLTAVSLEDRDELSRRAQEVLERGLARRKYDRTLDVRHAPDLREGKRILVLSGESGQGKTWQAARVALDRSNAERLVALVDACGDAGRSLQKASDTLWKEAWGHDQSISLDRLVNRWRRVHGHAEWPGLTVCLEDVESLGEARALIHDYDWERWGVELVLTTPPVIGLALENEEHVHHVKLQDFSDPQLREFLRKHGKSWESVRADVRITLKRPLLAAIYVSLAPDPDFSPTHEYELYERAWQKLQRDLIEFPEDIQVAKQLALTLLEKGAPYPWTWDYLRKVGVEIDTRARLEKFGWWRRTAGGKGVQVWHDRMLTWALAEALAEQSTIDELIEHLKERRSEDPRIRRVLGYLLMDVLWLLTGNPARRQFVPDLLVGLEEHDRPFGYRHLYRAGLLPTLGLRILQGLIERLRRFGEPAGQSYVRLTADALSQILEREPAGRAELGPLLKDPSRLVRQVAVRTLVRHPHAEAVDPLWDLLRESSLEMERNFSKAVSRRQAAFAALRACLELKPDWLLSKIREADSEADPPWELAYLLANLKHPSARSIWMEAKNDLFRKVRVGKLNSLMVCIRVFHDQEELPHLEEWLPLEERWVDNDALNGIAHIAPDRAIELLQTLPLSTIARARGSWFPILLLKRQEETQRAVRERLATAGKDLWGTARWYWWYEEQMDRETVEILLDQLAEELAELPQDLNEAWKRLRGPIHQLARIHRVDLLESFQRRADSPLDCRLGDLGAASIEGSQGDLDELHTVLLKIGGQGIQRLIRGGLASSNADHRAEAMAWGLICPDEIAAVAPTDEWTLAAVGEDRSLVEAMMVRQGELETEDLILLWRLRRWKPPVSDADLAMALEAVRGAEQQRRLRGIEVVSISGRDDLLSELPGWLQAWSEQENCEHSALDVKTARIVRQYARGNPQGARRLAASLNVRRFPWTAVQLLYEVESPELADRLEHHLLEQLKAHGQLRGAELDVALHLDQVRKVSDSLLRALWEIGKDNRLIWSKEHFFTTVSRIESEEVAEKIREQAFEALYTNVRVFAIRALRSLDPEEAKRAVLKSLGESERPERVEFVSELFELGGSAAVPLLIDHAARESKTEVLWAIGRTLRRARLDAETELRARLASPDFSMRRTAAHLAGWQGPGFLEAYLTKMAQEDPDADVQWECLQALARQRREHCVWELMEAFRQADRITRWSYLDSILELGDPRLLVTEDDPLWLGKILTPNLGILEVYANNRFEQRFHELRRVAEQQDQARRD